MHSDNKVLLLLLCGLIAGVGWFGVAYATGVLDDMWGAFLMFSLAWVWWLISSFMPR